MFFVYSELLNAFKKLYTVSSSHYDIATERRHESILSEGNLLGKLLPPVNSVQDACAPPCYLSPLLDVNNHTLHLQLPLVTCM